MIKLAKLSKALKSVTSIFWIKKGKYDYILTDSFIIKTINEIKGSALTKLISELGTIPGQGKGLQVRNGHRREMTDDEIKNMLSLLESKDSKQISFTNLLSQLDKQTLTIFKGEKDYIYVNKIYVDLVDLYGKNIEILGINSVTPVFFKQADEEIMILPIRVSEDPFYLRKEEI